MRARRLRRTALGGCTLLAALLPAAGTAVADANAFDFESVIERARTLAAEPYRDEKLEFTGAFRELDYDRYRDIRFRIGSPVWQDQGSPFEIDLLPPGFFFDRPVEINVVENGAVRTVPYANDWFDFGPLVEPPDNPEALRANRSMSVVGACRAPRRTA